MITNITSIWALNDNEADHTNQITVTYNKSHIGSRSEREQGYEAIKSGRAKGRDERGEEKGRVPWLGYSIATCD